MSSRHRKPLSPVLLWPLIVLGTLLILRSWWPAESTDLAENANVSQDSETTYYMWCSFQEPTGMSITLDASERDAMTLMTARLTAPVVIRFRCDDVHTLELSGFTSDRGADLSIRAELSTLPVSGRAISFVRNELLDVALSSEDLARIERGDRVSFVYILSDPKSSNTSGRQPAPAGSAASDDSDVTVLARLTLFSVVDNPGAMPDGEGDEYEKIIEVSSNSTK